jgi:diguanylate cyclase (GGDEF)-like protein
MGWASKKFGTTESDRMRTASEEPAHIADNSVAAKSAWHSRPIRLIIISGIILVGAVIAVTAGLLLNLRDRDLAESKRELSRLTLILAEQIDHSFQSAELIQTAVIERMQSLGIASAEELERWMSGYDTHQRLKDQISALPYIDAIVLTDAKGKLINFSRSWPIPSVKIPDEDPSELFKSDPPLISFVGKPMRSPVTGTWVFPVVRKFTGPDGKFLGVVKGVIDTQQLEQHFKAITNAADGSIALFRRDGTLLARYPRPDAIIGKSIPRSGLFENLQPKFEYGTIRKIGEVDGKDRLISARALAHYPVVVVATTSVAEALANWKRGAITMTAAALMIGLLIGGMVIVCVWQVGKKFREKNLQRDTALENMSQGLVMFDSAARLVMCNDRYRQIYNMSPDLTKPDCAVLDLLKSRVANGTFSGNPEKYVGGLLATIAQGETAKQEVETGDGRIISVVNQPMVDGGWIATHEDITERRRTEAIIARMAHYDALTGLPNRALFLEELDRALALVQRGGRFALLYLDLDQFKRVNDTLGHIIGDELLKIVADRLRGCVRETDLIARLGGDEFAIIQTSLEPSSDPAALAERISEALKAPSDIDRHKVVAGVSIGIAIAPNDAADRDQLVKCADMALYGAKGGGRGTYCFYEPELDARVKARHKLDTDLCDALANGEFELYYQPIVNLQTNQVSGCEALLRWHHPERGMVEPTEFIPVAEENGLIASLGEWVLRQACADAATWPDGVKVAVNLSPTQLMGGKLLPVVINALAASGMSASRLELEITESVLMQNTFASLAMLHQLRDIGVRIAMDDFGTGYSSLSYLRSFPFDKIKIDRSFIEGISEENDCAAIVEAVIDMAHRLNMTTTAEGIETVEQREKVRELGCTELQGYLFSRPKPLAEILPLLAPRAEMVECEASAA